MTKFIYFIFIISLFSCSTAKMKVSNKNPGGISILNITKMERAKAYRIAEKHCAKYYKVPRLLKPSKQDQSDKYESQINTMVFECSKYSN